MHPLGDSDTCSSLRTAGLGPAKSAEDTGPNSVDTVLHVHTSLTISFHIGANHPTFEFSSGTFDTTWALGRSKWKKLYLYQNTTIVHFKYI